MKNSYFALTIFALLFSSFMISASENVLTDAFPGASNTKLVEFKDIKSPKVRAAFTEVDLAYEMGDGYYDVINSAYYMVFTKEGHLAGFMEAALMSYTEDPELYLVAAFVDTRGERVGEVYKLRVYMDGHDDEELADLPAELQP